MYEYVVENIHSYGVDVMRIFAFYPYSSADIMTEKLNTSRVMWQI